MRSFLALSCLMLVACHREPPRIRAFPEKVLWAWESVQDLRFLQHGEGVAFLGGELILEAETARFQGRRNPLRVNPRTPLMAVLRVETHGAALVPSQVEALVARALQLLTLPGVTALQIDFDAARSERGFYASALKALRSRMPEGMPLSVTALTSWCADDGWIREAGLEGVIDEAVPMLFRMGPEAAAMRARLARREDWRLSLAQHSYGLTTDEPLPKLRSGRRCYVFHPGPWRAQDWTRVSQDLP
jgi:hypothetical protein